MTFTFEKERMTAFDHGGSVMGYIAFPRIRPNLVNISQVFTHPDFRRQGVGEAMMEAVLTHLLDQNQKAALTCPFAQQYVGKHPQWKAILPGEIRCVTH